MSQENQALLTVHDLNISYGAISAVKGISFDVNEGEIVTLIGANGAGKSSTLRAISGIIPYKGTITYRGRDLHKIPADKIVDLGIAQVPEGRGIIGNLTVLENMKLAPGGARINLRLHGITSAFLPSFLA
jgi:branched-chain amino acid transport system ATP-binding protein